MLDSRATKHIITLAVAMTVGRRTANASVRLDVDGVATTVLLDPRQSVRVALATLRLGAGPRLAVEWPSADLPTGCGAGAPGAVWKVVATTQAESVDQWRVNVFAPSGDTTMPGDAVTFGDHLALIVMALAGAGPESSIGDCDLLTDAEHAESVVRWNANWAPPRPSMGVHEVIASHARRRPAALALSGVKDVSYGQLDDAANRLANALVKQRVRPGDLVGIALPRSSQQVVAMLAVLKCGAAYVPLDVDAPKARQAAILGEARPTLVLTGGPGDVVGDWPVLDLDAVDEDISSRPVGPTEVAVPPGAAFCIVHTSGSTGRPKGVVLTHRGVLNAISWERTAYEVTSVDRLLHLASFSFSLAIVEVFGPLLAGATVVLAPPRTSVGTAELAELVIAERITLLSVVPAELAALISDAPPAFWNTVRLVITGADVLPVDVVNRMAEIKPRIPLINVYGQTEGCVDVLAWTCRPDPDAALVPVGYPIDHTEAYILDRWMRPLPAGAAGELYTGGNGLAQGYLSQPRVTAERFVPNPFARSSGTRLYRSGDFARRRPDGAVEVLGRIDRQVQIRGVRVELGEIESAVRSSPNVLDAVVELVPGLPTATDEELLAALAVIEPQCAERLLRKIEAQDPGHAGRDQLSEAVDN